MQAGPVDPGVLGARLRQQSRLDDPTTGDADPLEVEARSPLWPQSPHWTLIELDQVSEAGARRLEEYRFVPEAAARGVPGFYGVGLPVAILFERSPNGSSCARIYCSRALAAARGSMLPSDPHLLPGLDAGDVVARYLRALRAADVEAALQCFEPDGYLQRSDGYVCRRGAELAACLTELYAGAGAGTGIGADAGARRGAGARAPSGIGVRLCSRIDDGMRTALELNIDAPDGGPGLVLFERGQGGALAALRLYR